MSTNNSVPGMVYPTQKAMLAGNPRDSAMASMQNASTSQNNANQALAGGRRKKHYGGASIVIPQYQMQYTPQGGTGTNPNDQIKTNATTSTQTASNKVYDNQATKLSGGSKKRRRGGNPDWVWGCLSGGKKRTRKHVRKTRKSRKNRKYRKR